MNPEMDLEQPQADQAAFMTNSAGTGQLTFKCNSTLPGPNVSSSSSVKIKKSANIFSALVRKARRKNKSSGKNGDEGKHVQNLSGSSTLSLAAHHIEEVEINCENYEKKTDQEMLWEGHDGVCSETNTSNHSSKTGLANLLHHPKSCSTFKGVNSQLLHRNAEGLDYSNEEGVVTSFINFRKPTLNVDHAEALQYLQELVNNFQDSETRIMNLIVKYVADPTVQKEIKNAISNHTKLQWEAERRSCALANDMWTQQLEVGRAQERILQGTLNALVKQNRQLQIENESLYRKYERASKFLKGYANEHKNRFSECDSQLDSVLRHNEKLQIKLESVFKKIESLEGELSIFQKQNDNMEDQLRSYTVKMQNMKSAFHKMKTDYEIEQVALNFKLESKEQLLREAFEVGDILLDDLDSLNRQLKNLPFTLNWTKIKVRSNCLTDLFHLSRSCINELAKELLNSHTELALKDKDIAALRESHRSLQENFKNSIGELESMSKRVEEQSSAINERHLLEQRCKLLENEVKASEEKVQRVRTEYEIEKSNLIQNLVGSEKQSKEIEDKEKMIEQSKLIIANITSENYGLQNEIMALNRLINESGAGDMLRQIEQSSEEMDFYRAQLEAMKKENAHLKAQAETSKHENAAIIVNQEMAFKSLQRQIKDMERMNEEAQNLRQKLDFEHQTVSSLQTERMKYLEEKSMLKTIIQHLKGELSKMGQLEESMAGLTKEASKLSIIAEFNKQQGEKLKQEISQRDSVIAQLKDSMQKMSEVQLQHSKEKLALCHELNEVSQLKEKLNEVLNTEVKRNAELGQSKEAIVKSVNSKIQRIEEKHKNERTAIRILLKDIKAVTEEKEETLKEKYKLEMDMEQLKSKLAEQGEKLSSVVKELAIKNDEIKELRKEIDRYEKQNRESKEKLEAESNKYDLNLKQLKKLIEQLRNEKKDVENSNEYLKNNIEKLQKDLNEKRQLEKLTADSLGRLKQEHDESRKLLNDQVSAIKELIKEKEQLTEEKLILVRERNSLAKDNECLNSLMETVVNDFEKSIKTAETKEKIFKEEIDETKQLLFGYDQELRDLKQSLELKEKRIEELQDLSKMDNLHEKRLERLREETEQLHKKCAKLKESNANLETQLSDLQDEHSKAILHVTHLEKEAEVLESQLKIVLDQKEEDYMFYKKHIAEISRARDEIVKQSQKEIDKLHGQLQDLNNRLSHEKTAYDTLSQVHKEVSAKFMRSIKDLVEEKNDKQDLVEKAKEDRNKMESVEEEKRELRQQVDELNRRLEEHSLEIKRIVEEKNNLQKKCLLLQEDVEKEKLKVELEETNKTVHRLRLEIAHLQKQIALLELEKSEISLSLHETEKKLETEKSLGEQLKNTQKLLLAAVIQLRDEGKVESSDCIHLLHMMEYLSDRQLHHYEQTINQIQQEHETHQKITQKIDKLNNELAISNLSTLKPSQKIGHVNVKIFSDFVDLFTLYRDELRNDYPHYLRKSENSKFYLIEVFITEALRKMLKGLSWSVWLCLKHEGASINKSFKVSAEFSLPLLQVFPVDPHIIDCQVSAYLHFQSDDRLVTLLLDTVTVDISYHFEMLKKNYAKVASKEKKFLKIVQSHDSSLSISKPLLVEFKFSTQANNKEFIKHFIQNCYHKVDIELFSELAGDSKNEFVIKFSTGDSNHSLRLDKENRVVTLRSNNDDLRRLKTFFECVMEVENWQIKEKFLKEIRQKLRHNSNDKEELCKIYHCLRNAWAK